MSIPNYFSPLRYPGGKGKITEFVKAIIRENRLIDGHYAEPYAGGAAVAIELLLHDYVSRIHINDLSRSIYAFWHSVLHDSDALCALIETTPITMDTWYRQKVIQTSPDDCDLLQLGFSTFFLNRCNRSGILAGGVIGGKDQTGGWKLDARFNKVDLIRRIRQISRHSKRISLYNVDAANMVNNILPGLPAQSLIYLDPPYYVKGEGLYDNFYTDEDHANIAMLVAKKIKKQRWMVSYDNVPQIAELYTDFRSMSYRLNYSAADRIKGSEIIFFSDNLIVPRVPDDCPMHAA